MVCDPIVSADVENCALPPESEERPSVVAPSANRTLPVAVFRETVAVNVTVLPNAAGFFDEATLVVDACPATQALLTQVWPVPHTVPQPPQLLLLAVISTHPDPQSAKPLAQA